jgi:hypothetical protein
MPRPDIYVSIDIEADGPLPGPNSMISLGAAAFVPGNLVPVATFEINFAPLEGAAPDPATMAWWRAQDPEVWAHVTRDPVPPEEATRQLVAWVKTLPGTPVMVMYPSWDYMWVQWYFIRFAGKNPFGLAALDIKSYAFALLDIPGFRETSKRNMPIELFEGAPPHTHKGLDDAIGQGVMFLHLLARKGR